MPPLEDSCAAENPIGIAAELNEVLIPHDALGHIAADANDLDAGQATHASEQVVVGGVRQGGKQKAEVRSAVAFKTKRAERR